jgi:arylformamidase
LIFERLAKSDRTGFMDLNAQYNNRALVPDHASIVAGWARDAEAYRAAHGGGTGIAYGSHERHAYDLFSGGGAEAPLVVFIHGGYWQALDRSLFSHMAAGCNAHGLDVAVPSYRLAPEVGVADIISDLQALCLHLWQSHGRRLVVCGHSAGGHLAACMMAAGWAAHGAPADLVRAGMGVSGLYDLRPLMAVYVNDALKMDEEAARAASPLCWAPPKHGRFEAWVGGDESREYHRQSETLAATWLGAGLDCSWVESAGDNHFTVVRHLADADSAMTKALVALAGRT